MTSKTDYTNLLDMSTKYARKLDGQRVLVIGGSTGIGFAVAEAAFEHGANVIISSSNRIKIDAALKRLENRIQSNHLPVRKMFSKVCNLANPETIEANVKELLESASQDGKLDHVVFTAGDFNPSPSLDSATVSVISKISMVRVMGAVFVAKHLSSYTNQSNNSSFTITGTTTDSRPAGAGWSVLKAAAGGIEPMTRALCIDLKQVRVNCVTPGFVHTALFDGFPEDVRDVIFPAMEKDSVVVGVQAGPCKPSSVTTTTGTASTDVNSITSIATSGEPTTTTTEAATTATSLGEYVCLKDPAPVGKGCNAQGGGQGDLQTMGNMNTLTLASCYKSCLDRPGCIAISLQPGSWCALWAGSFTGTSGGESAWSWYDMDCFCDESSSTTSGLATGTTATQAPNSETATTSVELTSTTEAAPATTTTTGAEFTYSCPGGFPADSLCEIKFNHIGGSVGRIVGELAGEPAASLDNCVKACVANKDCDFFAYWPDQFCEFWEGTYEPNESATVPWNWYELSCFCVPGSEATTTEATGPVPPWNFWAVHPAPKRWRPAVRLVAILVDVPTLPSPLVKLAGYMAATLRA
ncbi:verA [Fusarium circinatum]|uniref:VerA n=1 Tax=Fusarium circinatum TaxID=48490 RepID=A0A8H5SVN3_FUSCI|nr:verA [Fusarium circinatum]